MNTTFLKVDASESGHVEMKWNTVIAGMINVVRSGRQEDRRRKEVTSISDNIHKF